MCQNCFHISNSFERPEEICHQNTPAIIKMRKAEQQKLEFKNNQERWFAQTVGFFIWSLYLNQLLAAAATHKARALLER